MTNKIDHPDMVAHRKELARAQQECYATFGPMLGAVRQAINRALEKGCRTEVLQGLGLPITVLQGLMHGVRPSRYYQETYRDCASAVRLAIKTAGGETTYLEKTLDFFDERGVQPPGHGKQ